MLTVDQPAAQQMLVNIFGSSLTAPTNPPPDVNGYPEPPPPDTHDDGASGQPGYPLDAGARRHGGSAALVRPDDLHPELTGARPTESADHQSSLPEPNQRAALALVHSGEGRDVMTRPLGPVMVSSSLALPFMVQPSECTR